MLILHATQKLLNTSRLPAIAYISKPGEGQLLHSWYAMLFSSSFPGKLMVMYVHEPSFLTIVCRGKTIKSTWPVFRERLPRLLERSGFPALSIEQELLLANDFVVAKTNSKSMLAGMNQVVMQLEYFCGRYHSWEDIELDELENSVMTQLFTSKLHKARYISPQGYWAQQF